MTSRNLLFFLLVLFFCVSNAFASGNPELTIDTVTLPQPDNILKARLGTANELAEYIKKIQKALENSFYAYGKLPPVTGAVVIAIKPNYQSKSWFVSSEQQIPYRLIEDFQQRHGKIPPVAVQGGPVVFAIQFSYAGGGRPFPQSNGHMPMPSEWNAALKSSNSSLSLEDTLALVWPDTSTDSTMRMTAPEGYEVQTLDTTFGSILKPTGWFYTHFADNQSLVWTLSRENPKLGGYKTGMRIQFWPTIKASNWTSQSLAKAFIAQKKSSVKIVRECHPGKFNDFTRICLETKESIVIAGTSSIYRIIYTASWSDEKNAMIITTFGAPDDEWDMTRQIVDQMSYFILIGDRFWK